MNAIEFAATHELAILTVGSRATCNPPPTDTDQDWLLLVEDGTRYCLALNADGWENGGSLADPSASGCAWTSYRKGDENIIITWDLAFYQSFVLATEVAKALNLLRKEDRITLFQTVRANWPSGPVE